MEIQGIDNSFAGSPFAKEESFHINFPPVILGTTSALSTAQEIPLLMEIQDLVVEDPDNGFPTDFTLEVHDGDNYSVFNNEITPDANFFGVLTVEITVNDGTDISEPFTVMIEVAHVLGLENHFFRENFSVIPNPVEGYVNVQPIGNLKSFELKVYDLNGRLLYSDYKPPGEIKIDLSHYNAGTYILHVLSDNKIGSTIILKR